MFMLLLHACTYICSCKLGASYGWQLDVSATAQGRAAYDQWLRSTVKVMVKRGLCNTKNAATLFESEALEVVSMSMQLSQNQIYCVFIQCNNAGTWDCDRITISINYQW